MNKKFKILIAIGGTGGHVFPGCHLAQHLIEKKFDVDARKEMMDFLGIKRKFQLQASMTNDKTKLNDVRNSKYSSYITKLQEVSNVVYGESKAN